MWKVFSRSHIREYRLRNPIGIQCHVWISVRSVQLAKKKKNKVQIFIMSIIDTSWIDAPLKALSNGPWSLKLQKHGVPSTLMCEIAHLLSSLWIYLKSVSLGQSVSTGLLASAAKCSSTVSSHPVGHNVVIYYVLPTLLSKCHTPLEIFSSSLIIWLNLSSSSTDLIEILLFRDGKQVMLAYHFDSSSSSFISLLHTEYLASFSLLLCRIISKDNSLLSLASSTVFPWDSLVRTSSADKDWKLLTACFPKVNMQELLR